MNERYLFVCSGNTCRSAMAEKYATSIGRTAKSVGTWATNGKAMNPFAAVALRKANIPGVKGHKAKLATKATVGWATIVLCMELAHVREVQDQFPEAKNKTFMLRRDCVDIDDPFGTEQTVYDETFAIIRANFDAGLRLGFLKPELAMR